MTSQDPAELMRRAFAAMQRRAWDEAAGFANTVLQQFGPEPNALMVLGAIRSEAGDLRGAIDLYERARALMPTHTHVLINLAAAYRATGRLPDARRTLDAALQVDMRSAIAHNNLGNLLIELGERQEARRCYERAAALEPGYSEPLAGLARIAEEEHRLDEAQDFAARALQHAPHNVLAALTQARVILRQGDAPRAVTILERLLRAGSLPLTNRVLAYGYLGEAYDKLARYQDAFQAFSEANTLQHSQYAPTFAHASGPLAPASVRRLTAFVGGIDSSQWQPAPPAARLPVFLLGFPRSGTTLLDQILASHPDVTTLEERDTLVDGAAELMSSEETFGRWSGLPPAEIERLRGLYWQRATAGAVNVFGRRVFIDKQPMNSVLLPLVHRLFPTARIVLALRDPRDVVLSCFQQRFGMNVAMYQLLRLDAAAGYYDAVMRLIEVSRNKLPLTVHVVKYEDVVARFEPTVRQLLGFLQLEWDERVRRFTETARERTIGTPSASQVVRPLYGGARGKWRNYRRFLEPCLPILAHWVQRFDYEPE